MVPSFGLFEFEPSHKVHVSAENKERAGYLSEVVTHGTEFGVGSKSGSEVACKDEMWHSAFF